MMASREIQYGRQHGRQILKSAFFNSKLSSGCSSMHTKCIFRLTLTHYKLDYLVRYKKKHNLKIKGNFRGQKVNIRSKNGVLRGNRSS